MMMAVSVFRLCLTDSLALFSSKGTFTAATIGPEIKQKQIIYLFITISKKKQFLNIVFNVYISVLF